jgi:hypothetical protein
MLRKRAQRGRETVAEGEWADMPGELLAKVLEELQAAGQSEPQGPFGFSESHRHGAAGVQWVEGGA